MQSVCEQLQQGVQQGAVHGAVTLPCAVDALQKDEFLRLAINAIHNDLISRNEAFQSLALTFVSNSESMQLVLLQQNLLHTGPGMWNYTVAACCHVQCSCWYAAVDRFTLGTSLSCSFRP